MKIMLCYSIVALREKDSYEKALIHCSRYSRHGRWSDTSTGGFLLPYIQFNALCICMY